MGKIPEVWFKGETIPRSDYQCQMGRAGLGQREWVLCCCLELGQDSCKEQATDSLNTKSIQKPGQYGPGWLSQ